LLSGENRFRHPYFMARSLFTSEQIADLVAGRSKPGSASHGEYGIDGELYRRLERAQAMDAINRVSYLEQRCYMLNTLLRDSDVMSMAHGLELRVPLIDHRLAGQAMALPGSWKLDTQTPKPLLIGALEGRLPDSIVHRSKRGFTLPFDRWLRDSLREQMEESLKRIDAGAVPGLNAHATRQVWSNFLQGNTSWTRPWSLFVLEHWCSRHLLAAKN
jgi:asparagine synthase (glutamine-hydrolysing)